MTVSTQFTACALAFGTACAATAVQAQACPDWQLNGSLVTTDAGTAWSPQRFQTTAGGALNLAQCNTVPGYGYMTAAPTYTVTYDAQDRGLDLDFRVEASCDTLMLINDATAEWHFNDDEDNSLNPRLRLAAARSGVYDVWVGAYGPETCAATLVVETFPPGSAATEGAPATETGAAPATPSCPEWSLGGAELRLTAGNSDVREVVAGGSIDLHQHASSCGIQGHGFVAPGPDFTLHFESPSADAELQIAATGECDTLLLVNDMAAQWLFNDDHVGLDPMISIPAAAAGRYDIWVGTFGSDLCRASMTVTSVRAAPAAPQLSK